MEKQKLLHVQTHYKLENATHCGPSLSEQLKSVVGFLQLLKTVLFDFTNKTQAFSHYQDSVIVLKCTRTVTKYSLVPRRNAQAKRGEVGKAKRTR